MTTCHCTHDDPYACVEAEPELDISCDCPCHDWYWEEDWLIPDIDWENIDTKKAGFSSLPLSSSVSTLAHDKSTSATSERSRSRSLFVVITGKFFDLYAQSISQFFHSRMIRKPNTMLYITNCLGCKSRPSRQFSDRPILALSQILNSIFISFINIPLRTCHRAIPPTLRIIRHEVAPTQYITMYNPDFTLTKLETYLYNTRKKLERKGNEKTSVGQTLVSCLSLVT